MRVVAVLVVLWLSGCASLASNDDTERLARAIRSKPVVLLGEVHDNEFQHRLRAQALRRVVEGGARPAIAFEQFDREHQPAIDRALSQPVAPSTDRVGHVIAEGKGAPGWNWALYRPYVELALEYGLPVVAANLSRAEAMRIARDRFGAAETTRSAAALARLPEPFLAEHRRAIDEGHCGLMPPAALAAMAQAQIARDLALAQAVRPHLARGVVLLTGNGHARNDIGVPFFLSPDERARTVTIGLLEGPGSEESGRFDVVLLTPVQPREDPCQKLRNELRRTDPSAG